MSAVEDDLEIDVAPNAWLSLLQRKGAGYAGDERNVLLALRNAPELKGLLRFNEFSHVIEYSRAAPWPSSKAGSVWIDDDTTRLMVWLQERDVALSRSSVVATTVLLAAKDRAYHPVRNYLRALRWDGTKRLE